MRKETLIRNGTKVELLSRSIQVGIDALDQLPGLIRQIIEEQMWQQHWHQETGRVSYFGSFAEFVETSPPEGLGTTVPTLIRLCANDPLVVDLIDRTVELTMDRAVAIDYAKNKNGHHENQLASKRYIATGASRQAGLRKLRQAAEINPQVETLRQAVLAGQKSINQALIEAGFRSERITVTKNPEKAAEVLARNFSREEIRQLIRFLRHYS